MGYKSTRMVGKAHIKTMARSIWMHYALHKEEYVFVWNFMKKKKILYTETYTLYNLFTTKS